MSVGDWDGDELLDGAADGTVEGATEKDLTGSEERNLSYLLHRSRIVHTVARCH